MDPLFLFDEHRVGLSDPLCRPCEFKVFCALCGFALGKRSHRGIFTTKLLRQNTSWLLSINSFFPKPQILLRNCLKSRIAYIVVWMGKGGSVNQKNKDINPAQVEMHVQNQGSPFLKSAPCMWAIIFCEGEVLHPKNLKLTTSPSNGG